MPKREVKNHPTINTKIINKTEIQRKMRLKDNKIEKGQDKRSKNNTEGNKMTKVNWRK